MGQGFIVAAFIILMYNVNFENVQSYGGREKDVEQAVNSEREKEQSIVAALEIDVVRHDDA